MTATAGGFEFGRLICLAALSVWVTMVASLRLDAGILNVPPTLEFVDGTGTAVGGDLVRVGDSTIHTFRQNGSFVPSVSGTVEVLVGSFIKAISP